MSLGQGTDLLANRHCVVLPLDQLLESFERKTGSAIRVALLLGAVVANASDNDLQGLRKFADLFGIAYQIKDDLDEFTEAKEYSVPSDYPLLLSLLVQNTDGSSVEEIQKFYAEGNGPLLVELIRAKGIDQKARDLLQEYTNKAYQELDKLENLKMKLGLYNVLGKVF